MFWSTQPATMEKRKWRTKTAAWWTFTEGKGREGQRMAICQWVPPAADENTVPWLLAKPPPLHWGRNPNRRCTASLINPLSLLLTPSPPPC